MMPDTPDDVIDVIGSPTFVRATSALKRMGFIGLLPDEQRFTWPSFCRMVLFSNQDKEVFLSNMAELAKVSGTDLSSSSHYLHNSPKNQTLTFPCWELILGLIQL